MIQKCRRDVKAFVMLQLLAGIIWAAGAEIS